MKKIYKTPYAKVITPRIDAVLYADSIHNQGEIQRPIPGTDDGDIEVNSKGNIWNTGFGNLWDEEE